MDLRREKRKENRVLGMLITAAALLVVVIAALLFSYLYEDASPERYDGIDSRAASAPDGITAFFNEQNASDEFSYEIKEKLTFESAGSPAKLLLKNPSNNRYLMRMELVADGQAVLITGNLAPGQAIKEAALDVKLDSGSYDAMANMYVIDPESYEVIGMVAQPITVEVKG